jgi:hypothetical protein
MARSKSKIKRQRHRWAVQRKHRLERRKEATKRAER